MLINCLKRIVARTSHFTITREYYPKGPPIGGPESFVKPDEIEFKPIHT
jgi:hypothetical protein